MSQLRLLGFVLTLIPMCLPAQGPSSSDTTPFRRGQWAVQFGGGLSMVNLGVLRFTSPRSAWLLDLDVTLESLDGERTDLFNGTDESADETLTIFGARLGRRFYQAPYGRVVSYQALAIEGFYGKQSIAISDTSDIRFKQVSIGASGELGAAFLLTPNLSLGGTASIFAGYVEDELTDAFTSTKRSGFLLDGIEIVFVAAFYF